jgi:hypothetical protein
MALRFALRSRIRLSDVPVRSVSRRLPPQAVPVVLYWGAMGIAMYAVQTRWVHPEKWFSEGRVAERAFEYAPRRWPDEVRATLAPTRPATADFELAPVGADAPTSRNLPRNTAAPGDLTPAIADAPREVPSVTPTVEAARSPDIALNRAESRSFASNRVALRPERRSPKSVSLLRVDSFPSSARYDTAFDSSPIALHDGPLFQPELDSVAPIPRSRDTAPPAEAPARPRAPSRALSSCEAAMAAAHDDVDFTRGRGAPDVTREAYSAVLDDGSYLSGCSVPANTALDVCVAVQGGRAVGVTVTATPANGEVAACVRRAVSGLSFPESVRTDVVRTHFGRAGR